MPSEGAGGEGGVVLYTGFSRAKGDHALMFACIRNLPSAAGQAGHMANACTVILPCWSLTKRQ